MVDLFESLENEMERANQEGKVLVDNQPRSIMIRIEDKTKDNFPMIIRPMKFFNVLF